MALNISSSLQRALVHLKMGAFSLPIVEATYSPRLSLFLVITIDHDSLVFRFLGRILQLLLLLSVCS